ncbi:pectate lyase family protein [Halocatena halophila]|uniref:right-handed parallel beta-helix repeat-containing protein n=1 Tax=Halocatena halophila TaxID=2814576 RepID=UPI002ED144B9
MTSPSMSIDRRTYLALVSGAGVFAAGSFDTDIGRFGVEQTALMTLDTVYQISPNYYVGPKTERPPASEAKGTIWEVTDPDNSRPTERTLSDGNRWLSISVTDGIREPGEFYLTPDDGFEAMQTIIDQHAPNVLIRLAPGTYEGSDLVLENGVSIVGSGPNATILKLAPGANTDLLTTPTPASRNVMSCCVRDITFEGNSDTNDTGTLVYGAFWNSRFQNCFFRNSPENGLWLAGSEASTDDNYVNQCQFINNRGDGIRGGSNREAHPAVGVVRVDTNWFGHNDGPAIRARGNAWRITNAKLYHNAKQRGTSIQIDRSKFTAVSGCDSYVSHPDRAHIAIRAHSGVDCASIQIKDNDFRGEFKAGVRCVADGNDLRAIQIRGNTMYTDAGTPRGVLAEGDGAYQSCAFTDNILSKEFGSQMLDLPDGWMIRDNL